MALLYQTKGIVLGWKHHAEADRWYSVLTEDFGKIEFRARGAHKTLAKLAPHLEFMAEVELLLVHGRQYETVAGVERKRAYAGLYQDYTRLLLAKQSLYLLDVSTRPTQEDDGMYAFLQSWLLFLESLPPLRGERAAYLLSVFALRVLAVVGYEPNLGCCLLCKRNLAPQEHTLLWHPLKGGFVCRPCHVSAHRDFGGGKVLQKQTLQMLRHAAAAPFSDQLRLVLPGALLGEFHEAVESLITGHFPVVPPNTLRESCVY